MSVKVVLYPVGKDVFALFLQYKDAPGSTRYFLLSSLIKTKQFKTWNNKI